MCHICRRFTRLEHLSGLIFQTGNRGIPVLEAGAHPESAAALGSQALQFRPAGELHAHHHTDAVDGLSSVEIIGMGKQLHPDLAFFRQAVHAFSGAAGEVEGDEFALFQQIQPSAGIECRCDVSLLMGEPVKRQSAGSGQGPGCAFPYQETGHVGALLTPGKRRNTYCRKVVGVLGKQLFS